MKLQIHYKIYTVFIAGLLSLSAKAQMVESNPLQYEAIREGNSLINKFISTQTKDMQKIAALQGTMAGELAQIKSWEQKYNAYLKTARGYAETIKAGTSIYADALRTFQSLMEIKKTVVANPQGIAASLSMNNLYMESAIELLKTFRLLKVSIAQGGETNMLTGSERSEMLWNLSDQLNSMSRRFHELAISIAFYNLTDVWRRATAGMIDRSHEEIAKESFDRWRREMEVYRIISN